MKKEQTLQELLGKKKGVTQKKPLRYSSLV